MYISLDVIGWVLALFSDGLDDPYKALDSSGMEDDLVI
jgi:hypothetical protein